MVSSDAKFTAGPANNTATAAPPGAPIESNVRASGISKNVGSATGTARNAANAIAESGRIELNVLAGS
jgi:hypothetical protein